MSLQQSVALAAILSESGLHGATAGTTGAEFIKQLSVGGKLAGFRMVDPFGNLDVGKSLQRMNAVTSAMAPNIRARFLERMGFTGENLVGVELMLGKWHEFNGIVKEGFNSQGVAASKAAERSAAADFQIQILLNRWSRFQEILGESLLGPLNRLLGVLKPVLLDMNQFAETHSRVAQLAAAVIGLAGATAVFGGAWQILGIGRTLEFLRIGAVLTKAWTAAQWLLNAALDANPIGLTVIAVAALATAVYEVYQHWAGISAWFAAQFGEIAAVFHRVVAAIGNFGLAMYQAGKSAMSMLAHGMIDAALAPVRAAEDIAHKIGRFFVGHSPIPEGALHDMNLGREIAASMKPGPVVAAVRQLAAAVALAIPLTISPAMHAITRAPVTIAPAIHTVAPALAAQAPGATLAMHRTGHEAAGGQVNHINVGPVRVNVSGGDLKSADVQAAVERAIDESTDRIATALKRCQSNHDRTNY